MMGTKRDIDGKCKSESYTAPNCDFEESSSWLRGDMYYLQGSHQDFIDVFLDEDYKDGNTVKLDPAKSIEIAKRALANGELEIAENYSIKAMCIVTLDNSYKRSPEPYHCLAEVLQRKAEDKNLELPQRQRFLLQAAALYNFVRNFLKKEDVEDELSKTLSEEVSRRLIDIQNNMVTMVGGDRFHCKFDSELKQNELKNLRNEVKERLESMECRRSSKNQESLNKCDLRQMLKDETEKIKELSDRISDKMKTFLAAIINGCLELLGTPPCDYEVIVLGSLARKEMTPYSDFEWAILTNSEEEECKVFFRNLTNLVHLQIINLGETILPSMNIEGINDGWFYDDITAKGVSFDGFLPQACKTPLGNTLLGTMSDFELIHTPEKMADFQNNDWYRKNWKLGDTLLTFSPLQPDKHILVDAYRKEMAKILSCPCDSECCKHDASCGACPPTRGSCRGLSTLREDLSCYGDLMTGNNDLDDGKFYDVKKEIYRLTDRVFAALAKCYEIDTSGTFAILDELYTKGKISSEARDNFASASAIAIKLRISTYLKAGKQGEQLMASSNEETRKLTYHMPNDEELFLFFFIAIPLYEELQKFKAAGNIPSSLAQSSFFDNSDVTNGHVYCRLLNYGEALKYYERALQQNPDNLSIEIRRINIVLLIEKGTEETDKIREHLDGLLDKIDQSWSEPHQETTPFVNRLHTEGCKQLLEVLLLASSFYGCSKYFELAEKILDQCRAVIESKPSAGRRELLMMIIAFIIEFSMSRVGQHEIDDVTSALISWIDEDGVSTKSIVWLNTLGEFLFKQGKNDKAYRCFQRALSMEHHLYGTNPNVNVMTSLYNLGETAVLLSMFEESEYYLKLLVKRFESFPGRTARLMVKRAYFQLTLNYSDGLNYSAEKSQYYFKKGLETTTGNQNDKELILNCGIYCNLATTWYARHNQEQAGECALGAEACLRNIVGIQARVQMTCLLAETLAKIKKTNEGIKILKKEMQQLTQSQMDEKTWCLMSLGEIYIEQGVASEAENSYKQALEALRDTQAGIALPGIADIDILECRIGISKAMMMDDRVPEAKLVLNQAFISAEKLPASMKKCSFLGEIGELCKNLGDISGAEQCFREAINTYNEELNVAKKLPLMKFDLELKLGELARDASAIDLINPELGIQAQRSYYDRAAEALRQHVATGQVNSLTVDMFLVLAEKYTSVDLRKKIRLLLETLNVSEIVYGKNKSNEKVTKILEELSFTYSMTGNMQAAIKYRELLIRMEMELHSSNPFHEHISLNLIALAGVFLVCSLVCPLVYPGKDTIERAYGLLSFALASGLQQTDKASTNSTAKGDAARFFTSLGMLFHTLGDLEKAETLIETASRLLSEIHESVEREKLPCETTCDIMKKILLSKKILPSDKRKLIESIGEVFAEFRLQGTLAEDPKTSQNCSNGRENVELFIPSSDGVNPESSNLELINLNRLFKLDVPDNNWTIGDVHQAAKIQRSLEAQELSFYESCPYDTVEMLISDAIRAKEDKGLSSGIKSLDLALQLPSNWRQKTKILKLRGECYLSRDDFRTAAINFTEAAGVYSTEKVENRDDLCKYSEVLIGLIKSEMLCQNVQGAWLICQEAIKLVSGREHGESVRLQAVELFYLGAKCMDILSESAESKDDMLAQACSLCQNVVQTRNVSELVEEIESSGDEEYFPLFCEVRLLLAAILLKLQKEEAAERILKEMEAFFINIAESLCADSMAENKLEFLKLSRLYSWIGRVLVMRDKIKLSIPWLSGSLLTFFSAALPNMLSFYEEFLPLLQAITVTKSSATSHESRSPFQQTVDMCKEVLVKHGNELNNVYEFLKTLANLYMVLGRTEEAIVVAETGLGISDLMGDNNVTDRINNRGIMLLYLAQMHQLNSTNPACDRNKELNLAEQCYLTDRDSGAEFVLRKNLSYANFLCEQKRFVEADAVLQDMNNLGKQVSDKFVYCAYFSRVFYGPGVQKSVEADGELLTTVEHCMYSTMVRVLVGMGKKREAVAACEKLTPNPVVVHDAIHGKRPCSIPYLIEACHRELLSLLSDEDRKQLQNCEFPLSSENIFKLYYMLNESTMALKYYTNETQSPDLIEMKISCLRLAGNELVEMDRGGESLFYFTQFLTMLQTKEEFLDKSFHTQCATLAGYSFANLYDIFRSLGRIMVCERGNLDDAIQCYERCLDLDEDFTRGQNLVATLADLYQSKALTVDIKNQDSYKRQMNLALNLFQKLFQKTAELTPFAECSFGSLLSKLERYNEAVKRFENVIKRAEERSSLCTDVDKPLVDDYLRREIEASGSISIPIKVQAFYELILTYMKLNEVGKAEEVALQLENYVERFQSTPEYSLALSIVGYAHKQIGNKEKAAEIFVSVLEINPEHLPVTEALESCCM